MLVYLIFTKQILFEIKIEDSVATWLGAIGTILAVLVALYLPTYQNFLKSNSFSLKLLNNSQKPINQNLNNKDFHLYISENFLIIKPIKENKVFNCEAKIEFIKKNHELIYEDQLGNQFWNHSYRQDKKIDFIGSQKLNLFNLYFYTDNIMKNEIYFISEFPVNFHFELNDFIEIKLKLYSEFSKTQTEMIEIQFNDHFNYDPNNENFNVFCNFKTKNYKV